MEGSKCKLGPNHPACFEFMHELALLCKEQDRYDDAERLLLAAIKGRRLTLSDEHPHTQESIENLIELYKAWNKLGKGKEWRAKLPHKEAMRE